jgi:hypothetical protein
MNGHSKPLLQSSAKAGALPASSTVYAAIKIMRISNILPVGDAFYARATCTYIVPRLPEYWDFTISNHRAVNDSIPVYRDCALPAIRFAIAALF